MSATATPVRVAVVGLGAIGRELAARLLDGEVPGHELAVVASRDRGKARVTLDELGAKVPVVDLAAVEPLADLAIDCAPSAVLPELAEPMLRAGKEVVVLNAGVLLVRPELIELAALHGGQLTVPTGALLGLDAVGAAALSGVASVRMTTRKPLRGLAGAPHLTETGVDLDQVSEPRLVFSGNAAEAAAGFPANLNVAAALALSGPGPERTFVDVWADPGVDKNTHTIEVESAAANLRMTIENVPSENPRTGRITALSVISLLAKRRAPLRIGS